MTTSITPECITAFIVHLSPFGAEYLLIRRSDELLTGTWQMVSGSVVAPETASQAALREIAEETGLFPDRFYSADIVETFYIVSANRVMFVPVFVAFIDQKVPIQLSPTEHDAYEWLPFSQAKERLVFAEQQRVLEIVDSHFVQKKPFEFLRIELNSSQSLTR